MRSSDYWERDPRTPHESVAGSGAWSLISSDNVEVGQNTKPSQSCTQLFRSTSFLFSETKESEGQRETDMSIVIQQVVCEFECVEGHGLLHPLRSAGRRVWVEVHPAWSYDISSPCHQPG